MLKLLRNINYLYLGLFLMPLSLITFLVFEDTVRLVVLSIGFTFVSIAVFKCPNKQLANSFTIRSFILFIIYIFIAFLKNQNTTELLNLIFGFVCFLLIIYGYILSKNQFLFNKINQSTSLLLSFILISISFYFISFATQFNVRSYDTAILFNPISVAYSLGILFMLMFSILYTHKNYSPATKFILVFCLIVTFFAILITQSKGTIIYLLLIVFSYSSRSYLKQFILFSFFLCVTFLIFNYSNLEILAVIKEKAELFFERIIDLSFFFDSSKNIKDVSTLTRVNYFSNFFNQLDFFIITGQNNYKPYPHNIFLELIMRWGLFSLPIIYLLLSSLFRVYNSKNLKNSTFHTILSFIFLFCCLQSFSSLTLEMNRFMWLGFGFFIRNRHG